MGKSKAGGRETLPGLGKAIEIWSGLQIYQFSSVSPLANFKIQLVQDGDTACGIKDPAQMAIERP